MLGRLVEFSLTQRVLVLVAAAGLALAGALAFLKLPVDAYPDIAPTQVKLILKAPGMTPERRREMGDAARIGEAELCVTGS